MTYHVRSGAETNLKAGGSTRARSARFFVVPLHFSLALLVGLYISRFGVRFLDGQYSFVS